MPAMEGLSVEVPQLGENMNTVNIMEIFSGAGGFSAALQTGLFKVRDALDNDRFACSVYAKNRSETKLHNVDITRVKQFSCIARPPDILIAGPPCQGFSIVGMKTKKRLSELKGYDPSTDPRNLLPLEVPRVAEQLKPKVVIMENVPAMRGQVVRIGGEEVPIAGLVKAKLEDAGFGVLGPFLVDARDVGVPQLRKRAFIVAIRDMNMVKGEIHSFFGRSGRESKLSTVRTAIFDLSRLRTVGPKDPNQAFPDHVARIPNADDLRIIHSLKPGEDYASLVERMPEVLAGRAHKIYRTDSFRDKFYRMPWDVPSRTIVAHLQKDGNSFIHPSLDRSVSVREAARIQSFPDTFVFGVPMGHAYRLVGNAVPPLVGKFLVEKLATVAGLVNERAAESMQFAG